MKNIVRFEVTDNLNDLVSCVKQWCPNVQVREETDGNITLVTNKKIINVVSDTLGDINS